MKTHLLDNPIWNALETVHQAFATGTSMVQKYADDRLPFMAMQYYDGLHLAAIAPYCRRDEIIFIKDALTTIPADWAIVDRINCLQMVYTPEAAVLLPAVEEEVRLTAADQEELFELVQLVQPGFFKRNTVELGNYYGIRSGGKLVAVAGERFKLDGFTELSAICTHPEYTGKRYAQRLITVLCTEILNQGAVPFLHVVDSNTRAIQIYERMGFQKRIDFPLLKLRYLGTGG
ncbi:GNAT family N-acetyltransferase [Flavobacterium kingsejongi]|uniref:N-acetyltransferase domain-containing protein n=1 Tax=Flavobacterium kingsejongi TaxID=1678728 RepID=A0A2S1LNI5_9FLAO|nr:GNAT family N-acetyltransferase [Flavobacterium kingsejongi]AWG25241.1 hypothetical protein FK004_08335 [Flavobacterium kingsejongi]